MNKAAAELLGALSMLEDFGKAGFGMPTAGEGGVVSSRTDRYPNHCGVYGMAYGDSSAALAISQRKGCGKLRHIRVGQLWIQERVQEGDLQITKVDGTANPADLFTKHLGAVKRDAFCHHMGLQHRQGRAKAGLKVQYGEGTASDARIGKVVTCTTDATVQVAALGPPTLEPIVMQGLSCVPLEVTSNTVETI